MRRIFQNTTAIAACLSLLAPQMAAAQAPTDGDTQVLLPPVEAAPEIDAATGAATSDATAAPGEAATVEGAEEAPSEPQAEMGTEADVAGMEEQLDDASAAEDAGGTAAASGETATSSEADMGASDADGSAEVDAMVDGASPEGDTTAAPAAETDDSTTIDAEAGMSATDAKTASEPDVTGAAEEPEGEAASEAGAAQADAAGGAAEGSAPSAAAALDDAANAEVTEEEVTEANSRSSSEDFTTPLQEAASTSAGQGSTSDGGGNTDLAKAVLLGLGGVAVGTMLSNNRQVALSAPDRIVVTRSDGTRQLIKDDVVLLRQPGSTVATENFDDGSSRTVVTRADGSRVVTIRDADLRVLRRVLVSADGTQTILLDDTGSFEAVDVSSLPTPAQESNPSVADLDEAQLREALMRETALDRRFSLTQIRDIAQLRLLAPAIDVETITFETGSAAIPADQASSLTALGNVIRDTIASNPKEMFLIEGHTDTVGDPVTNLALSDRRAESVALALVEHFQVPPENMIVQGYGEQFPKVQEEGDVLENRRAAVRRITDLLQTASN